MGNVSTGLVRFASIECKLQMSGELSVHRMVDALVYADDNQYMMPTVADVLEIGKLCEPYDNANGFRTCAVQIGYDILDDWQEIPRRVVSLMESLRDPGCSPGEFFLDYERIHPFRDGNGRSGQVLFNWLNGTTADPVWAPNWFSDPRRTIGYGA